MGLEDRIWDLLFASNVWNNCITICSPIFYQQLCLLNCPIEDFFRRMIILAIFRRVLRVLLHDSCALLLLVVFNVILADGLWAHLIKFFIRIFFVLVSSSPGCFVEPAAASELANHIECLF
jgi:hypothetical protein